MENKKHQHKLTCSCSCSGVDVYAYELQLHPACFSLPSQHASPLPSALLLHNPTHLLPSERSHLSSDCKNKFINIVLEVWRKREIGSWYQNSTDSPSYHEYMSPHQFNFAVKVSRRVKTVSCTSQKCIAFISLTFQPHNTFFLRSC